MDWSVDVLNLAFKLLIRLWLTVLPTYAVHGHGFIPEVDSEVRRSIHGCQLRRRCVFIINTPNS